MERWQKKVALIQNQIQHKGKTYCQLCNEDKKPHYLDLHEIFNRARCTKKGSFEAMPLELHALICRNCNTNSGIIGADTHAGRSLLLISNKEIWPDFHASIEAYFNEYNYSLKEYTNGKTDDSV